MAINSVLFAHLKKYLKDDDSGIDYSNFDEEMEIPSKIKSRSDAFFDMSNIDSPPKPTRVRATKKRATKATKKTTEISTDYNNTEEPIENVHDLTIFDSIPCEPINSEPISRKRRSSRLGNSSNASTNDSDSYVITTKVTTRKKRNTTKKTQKNNDNVPPDWNSNVENNLIMTNVDLTGGATPPHSTEPMFAKENINNQSIVSLDDSLDIVNVKIKLKDTIKRYPIGEHQMFQDIFMEIANANNVSQSSVFIFRENRRIHPEDSPNSIGYRISEFLTCRISIEEKDRPKNTTSKNENIIDVKLQSDLWKKPKVFRISRVETFKIVIERISKEIEFKPDQIKLSFDGDTIITTNTPNDLDFEGGEILDCKIVKSKKK